MYRACIALLQSINPPAALHADFADTGRNSPATGSDSSISSQPAHVLQLLHTALVPATASGAAIITAN